MNHIEKQKEEHEEQCLTAAIQLSKSKRVLTRSILQMLDGIPVPRDKNDSPDIIRKQNCNTPDEVYVGIEHFMVDQASKIKAGKPFSVAEEHRSNIIKIYDQGHNALQSGEEVSEKTKEKFANETFGLAAVLNATGYHELVRTFEHNLNKHLAKVQEYRNNIKAIAGNSKILLAFLIEIQCYAKNWFLNYGHNSRPNADCLIPMFDDIATILETINKDLVDYIVLYIKNAVNPGLKNVIAMRTGKIKKDLRSQNIPIFTFCGDDTPLDFSIKDLVKGQDGRIFINYTIVPQHSINYMKQFIPGLKKAYSSRAKGKPFVATRIIQGIMYAFGKDVCFFTSESGEPYVRVNRTQEEVNKRYDEFVAMYPSDKHDNNTIP